MSDYKTHEDEAVSVLLNGVPEGESLLQTFHTGAVS